VTRGRVAIAAAAWLLAFKAEPARAQSAVQPGRIEVAVGARRSGGLSIAAGDANETTSSGTTFRLFTASTTLASATSFEARVGVRITRRLEAQLSGGYGTPQLRISVSNDIENGAAVTSTERLQQFTVRGGAVWSLSPLGRWGFAPFVAADAGYLRELHEANTLVQSGRMFEIGGGATYPLTSNRSRRLKQIGVRFDARAVLRANGAAFDDSLHVAPALGASLYFRF
jgi:hypothetical protein